MAELKTKPTNASVAEFLKSIDASRTADCKTLLKMMERVTGSKAKMWGSAIVGFGDTHFKYASGHEGDWFPLGFSPRKKDFTLYLMGGMDPGLLEKLGKHKRGQGCLYIGKVADVDAAVLEDLLKASLKRLDTIVADRRAASSGKK
jgi:Domain of unknown function (DU1801)